MTKNNQLEAIIKSIDKLPPFPEVSRRVLELTSEPDVRYKDIIEVIKYDEAVTANCLRLCNSSFYGLQVQVSSLNQAVTLLGLRNINIIVLATGGELSTYSKAQEGYGLGPGELWRHSVTCAILSQLLAKKANFQESSVLYTGALLHDVGKLVLGNYIEGDINSLVDLTLKEGLSLIEAEREVFGIDHAELGGIIAETWQFPYKLISAIRNHHNKMSRKFIPCIESWVMLSNLVYYVSPSHLMYSYHKGINCQINQSILFQIGLKEEDIKEISLELPGELKKIQSLLKLAL